MSQSKSPDGTFPTFPQTLWVDGEEVNEDTLCVSPSADRGTLGKLIDAVGWLRDRGSLHFKVRCDGAGAVAFERRTPMEDGSTQLLTVAFSGTTLARFTFGSALADADDYVVHVTPIGNVDWMPRVTNVLASRFDVSFYDISAAGTLDLTTNIVEFYMSVAPNLAGMT